MRYIIAHKAKKQVSTAVTRHRRKEKQLGLDKRQTFERLHQNIESSRQQLKDLLRRLRKQGKRVAGYAATSKSTTVTNYCGITSDLVEFISDTTPIKQGKYSPGTHIPVRPYQEFADNFPDYALLFGWNHAKEIFAKEQEFTKAGGKWIVYVPKVKVLE